MAARLYASQCSSINPLFRDEELEGMDRFGANVAIGEGPSYSIPSLISQWEGQKTHYNYYCNTCDFDKCKKIKQVILWWSEYELCSILYYYSYWLLRLQLLDVQYKTVLVALRIPWKCTQWCLSAYMIKGLWSSMKLVAIKCNLWCGINCSGVNCLCGQNFLRRCTLIQ